MSVRCPSCGDAPNRSMTSYGLRLQCCGLWAWGEHPLADAETHSARRRAHDAFDPLWRDGPLSRSKAYRMLAKELNVSKDDCHMKLMTAEQASRVPDAVVRIRSIIEKEQVQCS